MKTIYTIGDSHAWHCWLKIPNVIVGHYGPMLMHSIGQAENRINHAKDIPGDAILCFCWGEIDCRCHVHKYQPYQKTIDVLVENYLNTIRCSKKTHNDIWVFNVVPPPRRKDIINENPGFPFLGSDEERLAYVKYMNKKLSESEFIFVNVYDKYADQDGFLKMELSDMHVHIAEEKYLVEWINQHRR
jgi:hypothetical protein